MPRLACLVAVALVVPSPAAAVGEAVDGFPNWAERVVHQWTNRARCDPQAEMTACGAACGEAACYAPVAPLAWSAPAGRSARFHADEMRLQGYFAHDSACTVVPDIASGYPTSCAGAASCACVGGVKACSPTCTAWNQRMGLFGATATAENIASPSDPDTAFYLFLRESSASTTCAFSSANGHRWNILKNTGSLGAGVSGPTVMDFAAAATPAKVPSGAHYPRQAASIEAWASWYDAAGPQVAQVVVDGACTAMTRQRGTATNGAWRAVLTGLGTGCHRYYFAFRDAGGAMVGYPTTGSLGIGDASCADWSAERPALGATCGVLGPCDPGVPGACDDGDPCTADACDPVLGCTHAPITTGATCGPPDASSPGCGCGGSAGGAGLLTVILGLGLAAPRRRRR